MSRISRSDITDLLTRGVADVIERPHLEKALASHKKLRVKHGIDPTGEKIHIGRAVVLWKLRAFQELGHKIVLIIGDFTAQIGDPSDKLEKRPFLSKERVKKNLKDYLPQIGKILDLKKTEVRYNSEWLKKLNFQEISVLADVFSVRQMIERDNFAERWQKHQEISVREFMYPLMQGYDSVAVKADVELGGTDQLFNLLAGRKVQQFYGQKPQDIMTTKMLLGTDGRKMSTSWGNVINIADSPDEQYGKLMAMHDDVIVQYFRLGTDMPEADVRAEKRLKSENPKKVKQDLARAIVARYHGETAATKAEKKWQKLFSEKKMSGDLPVLSVRNPSRTTVADLPVLANVTKSKSEAWRLVQQGGVRINDEAVKDPRKVLVLKRGDVIKIGKRHFFRVNT